MEGLTEKHIESVKKIIAANWDLQDRLATESLCVTYDRDEDMFLLSIGEPQEAITESARNRLYLRVDPDSLRIVGIEIPHVSRRLSDDPLLAGFLRRFLPRASIESASAREAASDLRQMVNS
jgi:hypothetical protein